jgi:hypothetical protein
MAPIARLDAEVLNNESGDRYDSQQLERNAIGLETRKQGCRQNTHPYWRVSRY